MRLRQIDRQLRELNTDAAIVAILKVPLPNPPKWARDRVDEICGGSRMTDDMPMTAFLRLAEYVAEREALS